MEGLIESY